MLLDEGGTTSGGDARSGTARDGRPDETGRAAGERPASQSSARGERFLPLARISGDAPAWLGMAALFAWIDLLLCFEGVLRDTVNEEGGLVHDPFFFAMTLVTGLVLFAASALAHRRGRASRVLDTINKPAFSWTLAACAALASAVAVVFAALNPGVVLVISAALGVVAGLFAAHACLMWGGALAQLDLREALLVVFPASCLQWVPLLPLDYLGMPVRAVLVFALPLAATLCLARFSGAAAGGDVAGGLAGSASRQDLPAAPGSRDTSPLPRSSAEKAEVRATVLRMGGMALAFSFVVQFMWSFFIKMLVNRLDPSLFKVVFLIVVLVSLAAFGLGILYMQRERRYRLELFYRTAFVACLAGVAACSMATASSEPGSVLPSYLLIYLGFSLAGPTLLMLCLGCIFMRQSDARATLGLVLGCQYLGMFLGAAAVSAMQAGAAAIGVLPELAGAQALPFVTLAGVLLLALVYTAVFPERDLLSLSPLLFGMSSESLERRCEQVASLHGLTPREVEVLTLLARGRDVAFIADKLVISRNTVSAHRKSIYAKLGVHSQQELMSAIERGEEGEPASAD